MARPRSQNAAPKERKRAKRPKVKTGCITCKYVASLLYEIRHLKCDEGKPACQRCLKDRLNCDGYQQGQASKKAFRIIPFVIRPPIGDNLTSPADAALFHHARQCLLVDFEMLDSTGFWQHIVLPRSHAIEPIKYALCALGGAHRRFLATYAGNTTCLDMDLHVQAVQKYNLAISHMKPVMETASINNIQTTLICCMVFICIENLNGRYEDSIRHMRAGCQLLDSYFEGTGHGPEAHQSGCDVDPAIFTTLIDMFYWLEQNVSYYFGRLVVCDLNSRGWRAWSEGDPLTPFPSLVDAENGLMHVDCTYDSTFKFKPAPSNPDDWIDHICMQEVAKRHTIAVSVAKPMLEIWSSRFELFKTLHTGGILDQQQQRRLALLSLHQSLWTAFLGRPDVEDDYCAEDSHTILDKVEALLEMETSNTRPFFSFDGDLVLSVSIVCARCRDVDVAVRALGLLRTMNRREGIWDSRKVADLYELACGAIESGLVDWECLPRGVPQLAEALSRLGLEMPSS
ncbi:hypothetical protein NM208_g1174 [Fusarium decemcellulare]|uniref:Uncharacterized protein n=1 Tax=Fusarium decemcellulare TaxID=57161 RepID=A0ACC1SXA0_9HYPO|nr:hypothetical protein NM208_g1174 [Fusarium decemcellulare]